MEPLHALRTASDEFGRRLRQVGAEAWDAPTPCDGWTVRELVAHVIGGNRMGALLLAGGTRDEAIAALAGADLPDDPAAAFEAGAAAQLAAFEEPGALDRVCAHPMGDLPGAEILGFRIGDLTVHAWDLARALGVDEALDAALVALVWERLEPMAPVLGSIGVFGEGQSGQVGADAPVQARVLDAMGRRP